MILTLFLAVQKPIFNRIVCLGRQIKGYLSTADIFESHENVYTSRYTYLDADFKMCRVACKEASQTNF